MFNPELFAGGRPVVKLFEALPSVSSAAAIFANAPSGTVLAKVTFTGGNLYVREDGTNPTATATGGHLMEPGTHYWWVDKWSNVKAIQSGGTVTGCITYYTKGNV